MSASFVSPVISVPLLFEYWDLAKFNEKSNCSLNPILLKFSIKVSFPIFNADWAKYILSEFIIPFNKFFAPLYSFKVVIL